MSKTKNLHSHTYTHIQYIRTHSYAYKCIGFDWNRKHFVVANLRIVCIGLVSVTVQKAYKRTDITINIYSTNKLQFWLVRYFAYITSNVIGIYSINDLHYLVWFGFRIGNDHLYVYFWLSFLHSIVVSAILSLSFRHSVGLTQTRKNVFPCLLFFLLRPHTMRNKVVFLVHI